MFSKEFEKIVENYIQAFIGSFVSANAIVKLFEEPSNGGYWLFFGVGIFVILVAHRSYTKRRHGTKENG